MRRERDLSRRGVPGPRRSEEVVAGVGLRLMHEAGVVTIKSYELPVNTAWTAVEVNE
jgi:hypothetical protein